MSRARALAFAMLMVAVAPGAAQQAVVLKVAPPKLKDVAPVYPEQWRKGGLKATVVIELTVGPDGRVMNAVFNEQASVGPANLFFDAAIAAIRQWVYDVRGLKPPVKFSVTVPFAVDAPGLSKVPYLDRFMNGVDTMQVSVAFGDDAGRYLNASAITAAMERKLRSRKIATSDTSQSGLRASLLAITDGGLVHYLLSLEFRRVVDVRDESSGALRFLPVRSILWNRDRSGYVGQNNVARGLAESIDALVDEFLEDHARANAIVVGRAIDNTDVGADLEANSFRGYRDFGLNVRVSDAFATQIPRTRVTDIVNDVFKRAGMSVGTRSGDEIVVELSALDRGENWTYFVRARVSRIGVIRCPPGESVAFPGYVHRSLNVIAASKSSAQFEKNLRGILNAVIAEIRKGAV